MRITLSKVLISALLASSFSYAEITLNKEGYFGEIHYDAKTSGNYIYTATSSGMVVIDKTSLANPKFASKYTTENEVKAIDVYGSVAILAEGDGGVEVVDISDPLNPKSLFKDPAVKAKDVAVNGDFVYVGEKGGISSFSLLDTANIVKMGALSLEGGVNALTTSGNYAYLATNNAVKVVNIANPAALTEVGSVSVSGVKDLFVKGNYLYAADGNNGLKVFDISSPSSPSLVEEKSYSEEIWNSLGVFVKNTLVFMANGEAGIAVVDDVVHTKKADLLTNGAAYKFTSVGMDGFIGLSNGGSGFNVIDYRDLTDDNASSNQLRVGASYATVGIPEKSVVKGNTLYVADQDGGLQILDITDPSHPTRIGGVDIGCKATSVAVNDDETKAYVTDVCTGLFVVDITDKTHPSTSESGVIVTPGEARDVKVQGDYAYVADRLHGLEIIDISEPSNMMIVGNYDTDGKAIALDVKGNYAYIADENETLKIIDISDPANPSLVGKYKNGYSHDIKVVDGKAYIANYSYGLQIVDVSDPANPSLIGSYDFDPDSSADHASGIDVNGNYAYLAYNDLGIKVVDVSDPANPVIAAQKDTPGIAKKVTVSGDYVYLSDQKKGIEIFNTAQLNPKQSFVSRLYRKMLHRTYDKAGLDYWVGELDKGKSAVDVAEQFFFSDDFRDANLSDEEFVTRMYNTFLDRAPDEEGLEYWVGLMKDKKFTRLLVLYGFAFSDEFKTLADEAGITPYNSGNQLKAFLERLYALVMSRPQDQYGKAFDQEGLEYWTQQLLSQEKTGGDVVMDFYNSPEFLSKNLSDLEFIKNAYYAIMGREADAGGLNYWITQLGNGMTRNDVLQEFIHSEEFQKLSQEYGIKPF